MPLEHPPHRHPPTRRPRRQIAALRAKLAPEGNVVSEAGRRKTIEVFGEPLTPAQVVERICGDVRSAGSTAVLEYTAKLDGKQLAAERAARVGGRAGRGPRGGRSGVPGNGAADSRRILRFQQAILHRDVTVDRPSTAAT